MANDKTFTTKDGEEVPVQELVVEPYVVTTIMRLQEDFLSRGEHLTLKGVLLHVIDKGIASTRHYWDAAEKNKNKRDFAKQAASFFGSDGQVRDMEGLTNLAIAKGIVRQPSNGSARQ